MNELDIEIAKLLGFKEGVDFGAFLKHDWKLNEDGEVDDFAYDDDYHHGRMCVRCYEYHKTDYDGNLVHDPGLCCIDPLPYSTNLKTALELLKEVLNRDSKLKSLNIELRLYRNLSGYIRYGLLVRDFNDFLTDGPLTIAKACRDVLQGL